MHSAASTLLSPSSPLSLCTSPAPGALLPSSWLHPLPSRHTCRCASNLASHRCCRPNLLRKLADSRCKRRVVDHRISADEPHNHAHQPGVCTSEPEFAPRMSEREGACSLLVPDSVDSTLACVDRALRVLLGARAMVSRGPAVRARTPLACLEPVRGTATVRGRAGRREPGFAPRMSAKFHSLSTISFANRSL